MKNVWKVSQKNAIKSQAFLSPEVSFTTCVNAQIEAIFKTWEWAQRHLQQSLIHVYKIIKSH